MDPFHKLPPELRNQLLRSLDTPDDVRRLAAASKIMSESWKVERNTVSFMRHFLYKVLGPAFPLAVIAVTVMDVFRGDIADGKWNGSDAEARVEKHLETYLQYLLGPVPVRASLAFDLDASVILDIDSLYRNDPKDYDFRSAIRAKFPSVPSTQQILQHLQRRWLQRQWPPSTDSIWIWLNLDLVWLLLDEDMGARRAKYLRIFPVPPAKNPIPKNLAVGQDPTPSTTLEPQSTHTSQDDSTLRSMTLWYDDWLTHLDFDVSFECFQLGYIVEFMYLAASHLSGLLRGEQGVLGLHGGHLGPGSD
jgi:hypothetical protein